jgi:hypothetical protein
MYSIISSVEEYIPCTLRKLVSVVDSRLPGIVNQQFPASLFPLLLGLSTISCSFDEFPLRSFVVTPIYSTKLSIVDLIVLV